MQRPPARLLASVAVLAALTVGGCSTTTGPSSPDTTGSIATDTAPRSAVQWRQEMDSWGERYRANPADPDAAVRYAQALRAIGQRAQAAAVLEQAAIHNPDNRVVLGAYGRALADNGSYQQALDVLNRAHTPGPARLAHPVGAGRGARSDGPPCRRAAALRQRAAADARRAVGAVQSRAVLRAVEEPPGGGGDAAARRGAARRRAEGAAEPRAGRRPAGPLPGGRDHRASGDLSPDEAAANVAYLRQMLAQQSDWKKGKRGSPLVPTTGS